jgi:Macrocin-O-methyltransferase (TylF)
MFDTDVSIITFLRQNKKTCGEFHEEALYQVLTAVEHVINTGIVGDFVEIGVYKGVMVMAMAAKLIQMGKTERKIHLYDTFEGMVDPTPKDVYCQTGLPADICNASVKSVAPLDNVQSNMALTGYPTKNLIYHVGDICKVTEFPPSIAFLRLDTDWYESTKFELEHFAPNVSVGGVITQDDYNWWKGATDAVNEYLAEHPADTKLLKPHGIWWFNNTMAFKSHSQAGQDLFVYKLLQEGREFYKGTFIDIGCAEPIHDNNSYALEKYCGWKGVLVDRRPYLRGDIEKERISPYVCVDVTNPIWSVKVKQTGIDWSKPIDYLSFDVDDSGASLIENFPFHDFKFKVLTVEHDKYRFGQEVQDRMMAILTKQGYEIICKNINARPGFPFEDWYVHPDLVDMTIANKYRCDNLPWQEIVTMLKEDTPFV